jgi:hypothetical protein
MSEKSELGSCPIQPYQYGHTNAGGRSAPGYDEQMYYVLCIVPGVNPSQMWGCHWKDQAEWTSAVVFWLGFCFFCGSTQGPNWAVFSRPWPWWAPGGTSHQVGWSGEARGPRGGATGGATGGAVLTSAPGRAAGAAFFPGGVPSEASGWIERARRARPGPAKTGEGTPLEDELQHQDNLRKWR